MQHPQDIVRLKRTYFSSRDQLLTLALGIGPDPKMFQVARDNGVPVVAHLRNTLPQRDDGARLKTLAQASLLRPGDEFIHLLHLPPEPLQLIKDSGCHVSLSPAIEMTMGHGIPAIQNVLDAGLPLSLSSDHAVTLSSDMFSMMRMTGVVQRFGAYERERTSPQSAPKLLTCREILAFGTINGAHCANVDDKVGTLTPGKEADLLMLKADSIDVWPLNNAYGAVVNLLGTGHVEAVFIAGRVKNGAANSSALICRVSCVPFKRRAITCYGAQIFRWSCSAEHSGCCAVSRHRALQVVIEAVSAPPRATRDAATTPVSVGDMGSGRDRSLVISVQVTWLCWSATPRLGSARMRSFVCHQRAAKCQHAHHHPHFRRGTAD